MRTLRILTISLIVAFISTIASAQVTSDFDKDADFSKYKTYSFAGWQKDSDKKLNDFDKKRILESFQSEFSSRGMKMVESGADVKITIFVVVNTKTSTTAYTNFNGGYGYGPRWGWGMGMGMGTATTSYTQNDYKEGTLVIDMYVESTSKLVWQGVLQTNVKEKPEKRDKSIPKKIGKLMKKYPVEPVKK